MQHGGRYCGTFPRRVGALAIVFVCVALAAPVSAAGVILHTSKEFAPGEIGAVTATCPAGQHVEVGGAAGGYDPATVLLLLPTDMHRSVLGQWTANGRNAEHMNDALTAIAFCWDGATSVSTTVTATMSVAPGGGGIVTAFCPPHTVLTGGGFHAPAAADVPLTRLERASARAWRVAIRNLSSTAVPLTAIAYCGAGPVPQQVVARAVPTDMFQQFNVAAVCPSGTQLLFGGLRATNTAPGLDPTVVVPYRFAPTSSHSWRVDAVPGILGGRLDAIAYCR